MNNVVACRENRGQVTRTVRAETYYDPFDFDFDVDRFDIQRRAARWSFGHGIRFCPGAGAALVRVQARATSVRGWATLPVRIG